MRLDDLTAELLDQPLEQFTTQRNARAKELKAAGQTELSAEVAKLKKPPVHLWAANQVAKRDRPLLRRLQQSAQAVQTAQTAGRASTPQDLRAASEEFQHNLEAAGKAADGVLTQQGHAAGEETLRRIREIFRLAALQNGATWERLGNGALIDEPQAGDDMLSMFQAAAPPAPGSKPSKDDKQAEARRAAEAAERQAKDDAERADRAAATAVRLRQEVKEAALALERAEQRAKAAEEEASAAREQAKKSQRAAARRA